MTGIGQLLHLAALFERGQLSVEIARNIGADGSEDAARAEPVSTGAGSLAQSDAPPDRNLDRSGARSAPLSLVGLMQPQTSLGMDSEKAAQLLLMLNGLSGALASRGPLLSSSTSGAPLVSDSAARTDVALDEQTLADRMGRPGAMAGLGLMAAALAAARAIGAEEHRLQNGALGATDQADVAGTAGAAGTDRSDGRAAAGSIPARAMPDGADPRAVRSAEGAIAGEPSVLASPPARGPAAPQASAAGMEAMLLAGLGTGDPPVMQTERAGVIASFILNAAMLPGWPERRFLPATPFTDALARQQAVTDEDIQAYLASLGLPQQNAASADSSRQAQRRRRLLAYLSMLVTQLVGALDVVEKELRSLADSAIECADLPEHLRTRMSL